MFDRYHIISDFNKVLDELRRKEAAAANIAEKGIYKGVRYLLLKGKEKIKDGSKAKAKLEQLLKLNEPLNILLTSSKKNFVDCSIAALSRKHKSTLPTGSKKPGPV